MNMTEYQERAKVFAVYEDPTYPILALPEEVGEFLGLLAKAARGDDMTKRFGSREAYRQSLKKEAGDILWQLCACLNELGMTLEDVAQANIQKLEDRKARDVLKGAGDER